MEIRSKIRNVKIFGAVITVVTAFSSAGFYYGIGVGLANNILVLSLYAIILVGVIFSSTLMIKDYRKYKHMALVGNVMNVNVIPKFVEPFTSKENLLPPTI